MSDTGGAARRGRYHHGDLASVLVTEGRALVAESGLAGFSVAELARRVGVSTAAPYRHFGDRGRLLAAVATATARDLAEALGSVPGDDAVARLAAATGAYVTFVARHGVAIDLVFAPELRRLGDEDLAVAGRTVMDVLVGLAREVRPAVEEALLLVEQLVALAHGYAALDGVGLTAARVTADDTPTRAARAARALCAPLSGS